MKHLGDITKINGAEIEPVDVITFGAPCQDLSVAGKRAGMKSSLMGDEEDTRSGLFFHAIRIIKEMREHDKAAGRTDESVRCRYAIYENVPGALSSNSGYDFAAILTELIRIVEPEAPDVPLPDKGWPMAGCFCADDHSWSVAYKVHDAQYWGVPQRRKRICVLADFNGDSAGDMLFDLELRRETSDPASDKAVAGAGTEPRPEVSAQCQGLPGNPDARGKARESLAGALESSVGDAGCFTLKIRGGCEGGGKGALIQTEKSGTLSCNNDQTLFLMDSIGGNQVNAVHCMDAGMLNSYEECCPTELARQYKDPPIVTGTLCASGYPDKLTHQDVINGLYPVQHSVVRRLAPLECTRLQGFPDHWVDIGDWVDSKGKNKRCLSKGCGALRRVDAHPYWENREKSKAMRAARKVRLEAMYLAATHQERV